MANITLEIRGRIILANATEISKKIIRQWVGKAGCKVLLHSQALMAIYKFICTNISPVFRDLNTWRVKFLDKLKFLFHRNRL